MPLTVDEFASDTWLRLPTRAAAAPVMLDRASLPAPPRALSTSSIVVNRGAHQYGEFEIDSLWWFARKEAFGRLGLLVLAAVFHDDARAVTVTLTHPESEVKRLEIRVEHPAHIASALYVRPERLDYSPDAVERFPRRFAEAPRHQLPWLQLALASGIPSGRREEREARDTVFGFGPLVASVAFATLLLDVSRPDATIDEVDLECDAGVRGVAPTSAEARLVLPGSFAWREDLFDDHG